MTIPPYHVAAGASAPVPVQTPAGQLTRVEIVKVGISFDDLFVLILKATLASILVSLMLAIPALVVVAIVRAF
jgi:hypothetical protein